MLLPQTADNFPWLLNGCNTSLIKIIDFLRAEFIPKNIRGLNDRLPSQMVITVHSSHSHCLIEECTQANATTQAHKNIYCKTALTTINASFKINYKSFDDFKQRFERGEK